MCRTHTMGGVDAGWSCDWKHTWFCQVWKGLKLNPKCRLILSLFLFVLSWQKICHSKPHSQSHGPKPGSLMRQVWKQCWIMQHGLLWQCHTLALNQCGEVHRDSWKPKSTQWLRRHLSQKKLGVNLTKVCSLKSSLWHVSVWIFWELGKPGQLCDLWVWQRTRQVGLTIKTKRYQVSLWRLKSKIIFAVCTAPQFCLFYRLVLTFQTNCKVTGVMGSWLQNVKTPQTFRVYRMPGIKMCHYIHTHQDLFSNTSS